MIMNAKFVKKEPVLSSESVIGQIKGPKDLKGSRTGEEEVPYYIYECEKGHLICRPKWYADVKVVPVGTLTAPGFKEHPEWYREGLREGANRIINRPPGGWFSGGKD